VSENPATDMTETAKRLAEFDARAAGWGFLDNEAGWPKIHHDALFLRRLLRESEAERERRQTELLAANNREVERRRAAEAALREVDAALDEESDGPRWGHWLSLQTRVRSAIVSAEALERLADD
jgi:hypothetical protein